MIKEIYNIVPYGLKCAVATIYGLYLNNIRYDKSFNKRVDKYLERETFTANQWANWKNNTLERTLYNARKYVP